MTDNETTKSYWNHRVVKREENGELTYGIHEVHYRDDAPRLCTEKPIELAEGSLADLKAVHAQIGKALELEVLDYNDFHPSEPEWRGDALPNDLLWFMDDLIKKSKDEAVQWRIRDERHAVADLDTWTIVHVRKCSDWWQLDVVHKGEALIKDVCAPKELIELIYITDSDRVSSILKQVMAM